MTAREHLEHYLDQLRRRMQLAIYTRGFAAAAAAVLIITCLSVLLLEQRNFAPGIATSGRVLIVLALLAVVVSLLWLPLSRVRRDGGARVFEERLPAQQGRIQTYLDVRRRESQGQVIAPGRVARRRRYADCATHAAGERDHGSSSGYRRLALPAARSLRSLRSSHSVRGPGASAAVTSCSGPTCRAKPYPCVRSS